MFCRLITTSAAVIFVAFSVGLPSVSAAAAFDIRSVPPAEYRGDMAVEKALPLMSIGAPA
jgi:hypothetical protein